MDCELVDIAVALGAVGQRMIRMGVRSDLAHPPMNSHIRLKCKLALVNAMVDAMNWSRMKGLGELNVVEAGFEVAHVAR